MRFAPDIEFARQLDRRDPLRRYRQRFHLPASKGKPLIYFTGNSLGLQLRDTETFVRAELEDWKKLGVEGHLHSRRPWLYYHKFSKKSLARLCGAKPSEVVSMNQLTVNLHLMLVSFFRPTEERYKIILESGAFSSDQYAFESQILLHGLDPAKALIELRPRQGEHTLRTEDIIECIRTNGNSVALVFLGAVQYYSGQFFDIKTITSAAHSCGAVVGFDLAHAIGNVPLTLHRDEVDFAVWCSYKYLNAGPGAVAGAFVHERHGMALHLPRLAGWWGHNEKERFLMKKGFKPMPGADGWQLSNYNVLSGAALLASLKIFDETGMHALRKKSLLLTGYLDYLLRRIDPGGGSFEIITPADRSQRGCQLSLLMKEGGRRIFKALTRKGVVADWREPSVIRVAPVPLYNTFEEVWHFADILGRAL
jgi:kynureninase